VKLIVVGRGGAGKTSLIKRLKGETFDPHEGETHGINIRELELACADGPVQARVWDFGGQHVLHAMHEFFLTARSLYLVVLGERQDMAERDAAYWIQLIRSYAGRAPVVVALNKSGGRAREMDRRTLEEKYGPILAWVPTECSEPDSEESGIDALSAALTQATDGMEEVRRRFPAKWFEIKKWLGHMEDSYLAYETYSARCSELGEADPAKQEELAAWLHDLGVALNYGRDPRLRDTTVLRPDWLANGIYAIPRANDTRYEEPLAREGIVTLESLGLIYETAERLGMLTAKDYPEAKWPFLLRLMSLFQLSFPLDEHGQRQLVPALLPVEEPLAAIEPDSAGRVRLRYEFNVVPAPLVLRLLVRTFWPHQERAPLAPRRNAPLRPGRSQSLDDAGRALGLCDDLGRGGSAARPRNDAARDSSRRFCRIQKPERGRADGVGRRVGAAGNTGRDGCVPADEIAEAAASEVADERISRPLRSRIQPRANERTAAFVASYTENDGNPLMDATDPISITDEPFTRSGNAFCTANSTPRTLVSNVLSKCSSVISPSVPDS
jgi:GTPase SAR1 family protein